MSTQQEKSRTQLAVEEAINTYQDPTKTDVDKTLALTEVKQISLAEERVKDDRIRELEIVNAAKEKKYQEILTANAQLIDKIGVGGTIPDPNAKPEPEKDPYLEHAFKKYGAKLEELTKQ
jgi:hypothetical protein